MLAQLESLPCASSAEVDHQGEYLRIAADDEGCLSAVRRLLAYAGYESEALGPFAAAELIGRNVRWYPAARVSDLSREEAQVLAREIVTAFLAGRSVDIRAEDLFQAAAAGLEACFVSHPLGARDSPTAVSGQCGAIVAAAAAFLLSPSEAEALGHFTDERLRRLPEPASS